MINNSSHKILISLLLILLLVVSSASALLSSKGSNPNAQTPASNAAVSACLTAKSSGLLTGVITGQTALVVNNGNAPIKVGLANYRVFSSNQILFRSKTITIPAYTTMNIDIETAECKNQLDLTCGGVLTDAERQNGKTYQGRLLSSAKWGKSSDVCSPKKTILSCGEALNQGLLVGGVNSNGQAWVTNNAPNNYMISLASYKMYGPGIQGQTIFDFVTKTVPAGKKVDFAVNVPACGYQIDFVCGKPITVGDPFYGENRLISFGFQNQNNFCHL